MTRHFASRMQHVQLSAVDELLMLGSKPGVIAFGGGYPDASLFPYDELHMAAQTAIMENGATTLQYSVPVGTPELRTQIAQHMTAHGTACRMDDVLVLHGGQQGIDLVAKLLIDRGDVIITEDPTFVGALIAFNSYEPHYVGVAMDEEGMDMDALAHALKTHPNVKLIYTMPDFHNPTGVTMSLARRKQLIALANTYDVMILEDSPYRSIRFEGDDLPTLKSLDTEGRVIYLGSFSKILAPGLRLGWAVAAPDVMHKLGLLKIAVDTQCSTLNMAIASLFMANYDLDAHIQRLRSHYRHKRDVMLTTMRDTFPDTITWTHPQGGLFTWVTFPPHVDATAFMRDEMLPKAAVAYVPGATFFPVTPQHNYARMNYSSQPEALIVRGVTALGQLLHQYLVKN